MQDLRIYVYAYMFCFVLQIGEKEFMSFMFDWHVYLLMFALLYALHCRILLFIVMHELRGSFFKA